MRVKLCGESGCGSGAIYGVLFFTKWELSKGVGAVFFFFSSYPTPWWLFFDCVSLTLSLFVFF